MSPQSAVGSLVFFTSALSTASTLHQVFSRPKNRPRALSLNSSPTIPPEKMRSRFKWFKTKKKYKFTSPPTAVHPHDDSMSICSESDMYLGDRRTLSVPDLANWNYSPMSTSQSTFVHTSLDETLQEEEEEEEEDWDKMIAADEKKSMNMFGRRRPSLPPIPLSFPPTRGKAEKRRHNRCKSLPQISMQDLPNSLYRKPTQRESWDAFYVIETPEMVVPQAVEESQIFIRMDMFNIRDFNSQIKALETLRQQKRTLTESLLPPSRCLGKPLRSHSNNEPRHDALEAKYQSHWEEAEVILDLNDVAQDQTHIFGGGRSIHVGIERTPSERHFHVLKHIIESELGDDASKVIHQSKDDDVMEDIIINDDDSDKENRDEKKRRRERLRISVDMVPCLIGRLKKLREVLSENVKELSVLAQAEGRGVECMGTDDMNLMAS